MGQRGNQAVHTRRRRMARTARHLSRAEAVSRGLVRLRVLRAARRRVPGRHVPPLRRRLRAVCRDGARGDAGCGSPGLRRSRPRRGGDPRARFGRRRPMDQDRPRGGRTRIRTRCHRSQRPGGSRGAQRCAGPRGLCRGPWRLCLARDPCAASRYIVGDTQPADGRPGRKRPPAGGRGGRVRDSGRPSLDPPMRTGDGGTVLEGSHRPRRQPAVPGGAVPLRGAARLLRGRHRGGRRRAARAPGRPAVRELPDAHGRRR